MGVVAANKRGNLYRAIHAWLCTRLAECKTPAPWAQEQSGFSFRNSTFRARHCFEMTLLHVGARKTMAEIGVEMAEIGVEMAEKKQNNIFLGTSKLPFLPETWNYDVTVFSVFIQKLLPTSAFLASSNDKCSQGFTVHSLASSVDFLILAWN